jgi:O-methyltransferase involved in polyketide biosynthesis
MSSQDLAERPNSGRMVDYWLGGMYNFEVDRAAAKQLEQMMPDTPLMAIAQRRFLRRAVAHLSEIGVQRFLDVGAGLPTAGNTHEVARIYHPDAQVVYADLDPVTVNQAKTLVQDIPGVEFILADATNPTEFFAARPIRALLAPGEPVGFIAVGLLHFLNAEQFDTLLKTAYEHLPRGSYLVASQATEEHAHRYPPEIIERSKAVYARAGSRGYLRRGDEIAGLIGPWQLTEDGIALLEAWRPDPDAPSIFGDEEWRAMTHGFVAVKS